MSFLAHAHQDGSVGPAGLNNGMGFNGARRPTPRELRARAVSFGGFSGINSPLRVGTPNSPFKNFLPSSPQPVIARSPGLEERGLSDFFGGLINTISGIFGRELSARDHEALHQELANYIKNGVQARSPEIEARGLSDIFGTLAHTIGEFFPLKREVHSVAELKQYMKDHQTRDIHSELQDYLQNGVQARDLHSELKDYLQNGVQSRDTHDDVRNFIANGGLSARSTQNNTAATPDERKAILKGVFTALQQKYAKTGNQARDIDERSLPTELFKFVPDIINGVESLFGGGNQKRGEPTPEEVLQGVADHLHQLQQRDMEERSFQDFLSGLENAGSQFFKGLIGQRDVQEPSPEEVLRNLANHIKSLHQRGLSDDEVDSEVNGVVEKAKREILDQRDLMVRSALSSIFGDIVQGVKKLAPDIFGEVASSAAGAATTAGINAAAGQKRGEPTPEEVLQQVADRIKSLQARGLDERSAISTVFKDIVQGVKNLAPKIFGEAATSAAGAATSAGINAAVGSGDEQQPPPQRRAVAAGQPGAATPDERKAILKGVFTALQQKYAKDGQQGGNSTKQARDVDGDDQDDDEAIEARDPEIFA